jgi:hypothetical protein
MVIGLLGVIPTSRRPWGSPIEQDGTGARKTLRDEGRCDNLNRANQRHKVKKKEFRDEIRVVQQSFPQGGADQRLNAQLPDSTRLFRETPISTPSGGHLTLSSAARKNHLQ